jgi:uncharacterized membrane protein YuzA (DUF378 family)
MKLGMDSAMKMFWSKKIYMFAVLLLVVGGLNWGYCAVFGKDLVSQTVGKFNPLIARVVFALVGIAALYVGFCRDTYLPFLGETLVPCSVLSEKTPDGASVSKEIIVNPGAKVLFWASEPATEKFNELNDWRKAYLEYANAGVTTADASGRATLRVRKPQPYSVPSKGRIDSHIHYRVCGENGFLGRVETVFVGSVVTEGLDQDLNGLEGFEDLSGEQTNDMDAMGAVDKEKEQKLQIEETPVVNMGNVEENFEGYEEKKESGSQLDLAFASPLE